MVLHKPIGSRNRRQRIDPVDRGWSWVVCLSCCVIKFLLNGFWNSIGLFFVHWERDYDVSGSSVAIIGSIIVSQWLLGPVASAVSDKITHRATTFASGIIIMVSLIVSIFISGEIWMIYITMAFAAIGLGTAWYVSGCYYLYYFETKLGVANSLVYTFMGAGTLVVPIFVQMSLEEFGWRGTLLLLSAIMCNISVCGLLLRPTQASRHRPSQGETTINATATMRTYKDTPTACTRLKHFFLNLTATFHLDQFCNSLPFVMICFIGFTLGAGFSSVYIYIAPHAMAVGLSELRSAFLLSLIGIFGLLTRLSVGIIVDKKIISSWNLCGVGLLVCAVTCLLIPMCGSFTSLAAVSAVFGLTNGTVEALYFLVIKDFVGKEKTPGSFAWALALWAIGSVVSVYLAGFLYDKYSSYNGTFICAGCVLFGGAVIAFARNLILSLQWRLEHCNKSSTGSDGSDGSMKNGVVRGSSEESGRTGCCCNTQDAEVEYRVTSSRIPGSDEKMKRSDGQYGLLINTSPANIIRAPLTFSKPETSSVVTGRETCV